MSKKISPLYVYGPETSLRNAQLLHAQLFVKDGINTLYRDEEGDYRIWRDGIWTRRKRSIVESVLAGAVTARNVIVICEPCSGETLGNVLRAPIENKDKKAPTFGAGQVSALIDSMGQLHPYQPGAIEHRTRHVVMANGAYNLETGELGDWSPAIPNTWKLPYAYDTEATCPVFDRYLDSITRGVPRTRDFLLEWMGYLVSGRVDLQQGLYLMGVSGSGKSTFEKVCANLVGVGNRAVSRGSLTRFTTSQWVGKRLVSFSDVRSVAQPRELAETLLQVIGNDYITTEGKGRNEQTVQLGARVMVCLNVPIPIYDIAGVAQNRFLGVYLEHSFRATPQQDPDLEVKLKGEMSGIFNRALEGLRSLERNGRFTVPETHDKVMDKLRVAGSMTAEFYSEALEHDDNSYVLATQDVKSALMAYLLSSGIGKVPGEETSLDGIESRCRQLGFEVPSSRVKDDKKVNHRPIIGARFTSDFTGHHTQKSIDAQRACANRARRDTHNGQQPESTSELATSNEAVDVSQEGLF
jgi:phage/plasmid primase, P4 family domain